MFRRRSSWRLRVLARVDSGSAAGSIARRLFGFANLKVSLAGVGGLGGVHAGPQTGFFEKVAPAFVSIGRALPVLVLAHHGFGVLPALDDLNYSSRYVGSNVVADEDVGSSCVVDGQRGLRFAGR